jgi:hypothetical protein
MTPHKTIQLNIYSSTENTKGKWHERTEWKAEDERMGGECLPALQGYGHGVRPQAGDSARGLLRGFCQRRLPGVWGNGKRSAQKGGERRRLTPDRVIPASSYSLNAV